MDFTPLNIIIVGGSLAGLMQGIALKNAGHHVRIFEQSPLAHRQSQAAGITCGPHVGEFFKEHNIDFSSGQVLSDKLEFRNRELRVTTCQQYSSLSTSWAVLHRLLRKHFEGPRADVCLEGSDAVRHLSGDGFFELGIRVLSVALSTTDLPKVTYENVRTGESMTEAADLVIAADGANSTLRRQLDPSMKRSYSGYVSWRGTVPEALLPHAILDWIGTGKQFCHISEGNYMVVYIVPSDSGDTEPGSRLVNWLKYQVLHEDSDEFVDCMTDINGQIHHNTVPKGMVQKQVWARHLQRSETLGLAPELLKILEMTEEPFITTVADMRPPPSRLAGTYVRLFFVGDAYSLLRPHIGSSTDQAALHALSLARAVRGKMTRDDYNLLSKQFYQHKAAFNMFVMAKSMGTWLAMCRYAVELIFVVIWIYVCRILALISHRLP